MGEIVEVLKNWGIDKNSATELIKVIAEFGYNMAKRGEDFDSNIIKYLTPQKCNNCANCKNKKCND